MKGRALPKIRHISNPQGEQEAFDRNRLVRSIVAAIRAARFDDEGVADMIAPMVEVALARTFGDSAPTVDDVAHYVEQGLRAIEGLGKVADCYLDRRRRNTQLTEVEEDLDPAGDNRRTTRTRERSERAAKPSTSSHSDPAPKELTQRGFHRPSVEAALVREYGLALSEAQAVTASIEGRVRRLALTRIPQQLLVALIDAELIEKNLMPRGVQVSQASLGLYAIDQAVFPVEDQSRAPVADSPRALDRWLSTQLLEQYARSRLHSPDVIEDQASGAWSVAYADSPARVASLELGLADLCDRGAGLGLDDFLPDEIRDPSAALDRIAQLTREARDLSADSVVLSHVDSALSRFADNAIDALALARGLVSRLSLVSPERPVLLKLDALAPMERAGGSIRLASALLDVLGEATNRARLSIALELRVSPEALQRRESFALIEHACARGLNDGGVSFDFTQPAGSAERTLFGTASSALRGMRSHIAMATLDLTRCADLACISRGLQRITHAALFAQLDASLPHVINGLDERAAWVKRFHARRREARPGLGPRLGRAMAEQEAICRIDVRGLAGIAAALSEADDDLDDLTRQMQTVLSYLRFKLDALSPGPGPALLLSDGRSRSPLQAEREQKVDDALVPAAWIAPLAQGAPGFTPPPTRSPWQARLDAEASLHALASHATLEIRADQQNFTHTALLQYLMHQIRLNTSRAQRLRIQVTMRQCSNCGNLASASIAVCPACGEDQWGPLPGQRTLFDTMQNLKPKPHAQPSGKYTVL